MFSDVAPSAPTEWWSVDADVLAAGILAREREKRRLDAEQGQLLAALDLLGVRDSTGYGSAAAFLNDLCHVSISEARARVERALLLNPGRTLTGEALPAVAPVTATAAVEGAIGSGQIDAIIRTLTAIPATVTEADREAGEKFSST